MRELPVAFKGLFKPLLLCCAFAALHDLLVPLIVRFTATARLLTGACSQVVNLSYTHSELEQQQQQQQQRPLLRRRIFSGHAPAAMPNQAPPTPVPAPGAGPQPPLLGGGQDGDGGDVQARLPGADWKARYGAAGVGQDQKRNSPIVEISMLLVRRGPLVSARTKLCCITCMQFRCTAGFPFAKLMK